MDRISKALEKARLQRKKPAHDSQSASRRPGGGQVRIPDPPISITYDKTHVERVTPQVLADHRIIAGFSKHPQADTYRILRTQVLQRLAELSGNTLGISSPNPEDGKTLTSVNLAVSIAMTPTHTVLLADLDMRRPSIHEYFGIEPKYGLSDYLTDKASFSDCLINPGIGRLVILPAGRALHNSSEMLASPKMADLAREIKNRYPERLILYDLPPLLSSDDFLVFLPYVDASLLVVQEGKTRAGEIQRSLELLGNHNLLGMVLNKSAEENLYPYY